MEKQRPLVLVTNDDGIASPGLKAAVRGVLKYADVIVAAPCRQQTGMGRAFPRTEDLVCSSLWNFGIVAEKTGFMCQWY